MSARNAAVFLGVCAVLFFADPSLAASKKSKKSLAKRILAKRNILALPSLSSQVSTFSLSSSAKISASPPPLKTIPETPLKQLFWREINGVNVIDALNSGDTSSQYCSEFFAGRQDGQSGGLGACHLAESVGYSYGTIVSSGRSLCMMTTVPSKDNFKSGGIAVNSGSLPDNDIEKLFSSPENSIARTIKVNISGEQDQEVPRIIYIRVAPESENKTKKLLYQADLWFCDGSEGNAVGFDNITISKSLRFTNRHSSTGPRGQQMTSASGFLVKKGKNLSWDTSRSRTSETMRSGNEDRRFKSQVEITKKNQIILKRLDDFNEELGKSYIVTNFSGKDAEELKFLDGAFKDFHRNNTFTGADTYKGPFYATDTESSLLKKVNNADIESGFYSSSLDFTVDTSAFSCSVTPDIEITVDVTNETVKNSSAECRKDSIDPRKMRFCHDDPEVKLAEFNFRTKCTVNPAPGTGPGPGENGPPPKKKM